MKVAIIGYTGQLGSDLVKVFGQEGHDVIPLGHAQVEVTNQESVQHALQEARPDVVINCAAFVRVDECEDRPEYAFRVNAVGGMNVARACSELGSVCIYISTDYVFGGEKCTPYTEEDAPNPLSVYGVSKLAGEYFVRNVCPKHFVVRTSGLYGIAGSSGKGGNFVETMIRLAKENKPIRVVDDQVLTPTHTKDLAQKIKELLQTEAYGLYHITNSGQCSWYEFAGKIFELLSLKPDFGPTSTANFGAKARRPTYSVLAHDGLKKLNSYEISPWQKALGAYFVEKGYLK
jgi:dTDP-4-dehydrorhamnose reductase